MANLKSDLDRAESLRLQFGPAFERERHALLKRLAAGTFKTPAQLERFHELVCFARAWPDSPRVLRLCRQITRTFERRGDLKRLRARLDGTGMAGTDIAFGFFLPTARWLAGHWPQQLDVEWESFDEHARLDEMLKHMAVFAEQQGLNSYGYQGIERLKKMRGKNDPADGAFLLSLLELLPMEERIKEQFYDNLSLPFVLRPGKNSPSRTTAGIAAGPIDYQDQPLASAAADLEQAAEQTFAFTRITGARAKRLIALARGVLVARFRDLDPIAYADPKDVRVAECGGGLQVVLLGILPERRLLLEAEYGHLILKNGVPVGYGSAWSLFGTCSMNFNIFPTFRGAQGVLLFARTFAVYRQLFNADTFVAEPYQLGDENEEAVQSGAWWFYNKLGYRPHDRKVSALAKAEIKKRRTRKSYRCSPDTLRRLALAPMFFHLGKRRKDVLGLIELDACGLGVNDYLSRQYGSTRARAERESEKSVCAWLGIDPRKLSAGQRLWLRRWSPMIASLNAVADWPNSDKAALKEVLLAKGGEDQSVYVRLFDRHRRLRDAILNLSRRGLRKLD